MKPIKLTDEQQNQVIEEFKNFLKNFKTNTGKIDFVKALNLKAEKEAVKPKVIYTAAAWLKIKTIVERTTKEIAWHGFVRKDENVYTVYDIAIYPQTVTGTTVKIDETEHAKWLMSIPDEDFNNMRLQGHSHVNMGVTPSGVDQNTYQDLLDVLPNDDYYLFMIINKSNTLNVMLYDLTENRIYEKEDIEVIVDTGNTGLEAWYTSQKEMVKEHVFQTQKAYKTNSFGNSLNDFVAKQKTTKTKPKKEKDITDMTDEEFYEHFGMEMGRYY